MAALALTSSGSLIELLKILREYTAILLLSDLSSALACRCVHVCEFGGSQLYLLCVAFIAGGGLSCRFHVVCHQWQIGLAMCIVAKLSSTVFSDSHDFYMKTDAFAVFVFEFLQSSDVPFQ